MLMLAEIEKHCHWVCPKNMARKSYIVGPYIANVTRICVYLLLGVNKLKNELRDNDEQIRDWLKLTTTSKFPPFN